MFYDLNIQKPDINVNETLDGMVERGIKYGYKAFAITTNVDENIFKKNKKEKKKSSQESTNQENVLPLPLDFEKLKSNYPRVHFYNRINFKVSDSNNIRKFTQLKEIKKYDLVSFEPENQEALKGLIGITAMDILSYNPENRTELNFSRKLYKQFVNQHAYFEVIYGPAIVDSTSRKNMLIMSHMYRAIGKSQNIIVTSAAQVPYQIRGPYDVINFNLLFGLSEEQSKAALTRNCEKLLLRARSQRCKNAVVELVSTNAEH